MCNFEKFFGGSEEISRGSSFQDRRTGQGDHGTKINIAWSLWQKVKYCE
jgi:hypothetical protein